MGLTTPSDDDLTPQPKDAADAALELMKQLITLSSGVLALSAAFLDKFRVPSTAHRIPLLISWLLLIGAIVAALDVISAIVKARLAPEFPWHSGRGQRSATISKWMFVVGMAAFAIFAFDAQLSRSGDRDVNSPSPVTIMNNLTAPAQSTDRTGCLGRSPMPTHLPCKTDNKKR